MDAIFHASAPPGTVEEATCLLQASGLAPSDAGGIKFGNHSKPFPSQLTSEGGGFLG